MKLFEIVKHCLFANSLLLTTLYYDGFDLEGRVVGVAVTVTNTIVQANRWDTNKNIRIMSPSLSLPKIKSF